MAAEKEEPMTGGPLDVFTRLESEVRLYPHHFPVVFAHGDNERLRDESAREDIDFFSGSGALPDGPDNPRFIRSVVAYLQARGIPLSLRLATLANRRFLARLAPAARVP